MAKKYFKVLIVLLFVAVVAPQIALAVWWNPFSWGIWNKIFNFQQDQQQEKQQDKDNQEVKVKTEFKNNYFFKTLAYRDPNKQYGDFSIQIYKDNQLIKTVAIKDTFLEPSLFVLSPNQKYVAFKTAIYGGSCVYNAMPMIIDLNSFLIMNLDNSDISKKINSVLGIDSSKSIKFSANQEIKDIRWISDNVIEVSMKFGDSSCPITYLGKDSNSPNYFETKVNFTIQGTELIKQDIDIRLK